jgi:hypothetical protein
MPLGQEPGGFMDVDQRVPHSCIYDANDMLQRQTFHRLFVCLFDKIKTKENNAVE